MIRARFLTLAVLVTACDKAPSAEGLGIWTPADHGQSTNPMQAPISSANAHGSLSAGELASITWQQQCVTCHGADGRGHTPTGSALKAPDFASAAWQKAATEPAMAQAIREGKGKMPKFDLPAPVVSALVTHVRALGKP